MRAGGRRGPAHDGQRDHARFARLEVNRVHGKVRARVGIDPEFQELAHARVAVDPDAGRPNDGVVSPVQDGRQRDPALAALAVQMLIDVDEVQLVAHIDAVTREVDDDVVALRDALGGE